jgi:delta14-sterol reductase
MTLLLSLGLATGQILHNGPENFTFIYDHFLGFITASLVMSVVQALYCYASSYSRNADGSPKLLALAGNSGKFFYDVSSSSLDLLHAPICGHL